MIRKQKFCIRTYRINSKKAFGPARVKIAFLTDIHNTVGKEAREQILQGLEGFQPDLVLIGGDLLIGKPGADLAPGANFLKKLSKHWNVWYANGNHEQRILEKPEVYGTMGERWEETLQQTKVKRLVNTSDQIMIGGVPVKIYGFQPEDAFFRRGKKKEGMEEELVEKLGTPDNDCYTVLLAHTPRYGEEYMRWGADLILSGHYHGGVMMLGKQRGLITPDFQLFNSWCGGMRKKGSAHMIVSAGLGEHTVPLRIHNPRELTLIEIDFT